MKQGQESKFKKLDAIGGTDGSQIQPKKINVKESQATAQSKNWAPLHAPKVVKEENVFKKPKRSYVAFQQRKVVEDDEVVHEESSDNDQIELPNNRQTLGHMTNDTQRIDDSAFMTEAT